MGNCVRSNIEGSPSAIRSQHQYKPTEQVDTALPTTDKQPEEPDQQPLDEQDQALPWQQQEALVQHIADREGVCTVCVSTCSSMHIIQNEVVCSILVYCAA